MPTTTSRGNARGDLCARPRRGPSAAKYLLRFNAPGSLRLDMPPGSVMAISDHINFAGMTPLFGIGPG